MAQQPRGARTQVTRGALIAATAAAAIAFFAGGPVASAAILNTFFVTFATTYALGMYSAREASKAAQQEAQERRETIRSAVSPRRVIYGEVQTGGTLVYAQVTGANKDYLHMVIALAGHEVDSIGDLFFDDKFLGEINPVTGFTTTGTYPGLVRVKKYLGTADQTADPDLVAESGGRWTVNHRLRGVAYIYVRLQWNQDLFLGIPNIRAQVRGKKVLDPRTGQTAYTLNPALHLRDYFTNTAYGLGCVSGEINDTTVAAAATICDQWVALASEVELNIASVDTTYDNITTTGGLDARVSTGDRCRFRVVTGSAPTGLTADAEYYLIRRTTDVYQLASTYDNAINGVAINITAVPSASTYKLDTFAQHRYQCNGTFTLDGQPAAIEEPIRMTMAGSTVYSEGQWRIYAGAYSAPTTTITADELRGDISLRPRRPRRELVNQIRGTYVDPARNWVATDFPPYTDATYVAQDGGEVISRSIDLSWVINPFQAQRVAKIFMNRNRSVQMSMPCKISALRVATAESVNVTIDELGYENEVFRVVGWKLNGEDGGIGIDLSLEADSAAVYDWAAADAVNPPTLVTLDIPDPRSVAAPANLQLFSGNDELLLAGDGTVISRIRVAWTAPAALNIAGYEVSWRKGTETEYTTSAIIDGRQLSYTIAPVQDGVDYDVRVRTINSFGSKSEWSEITDYAVVGKTAAPAAPTSLTVTPDINGFDIVWSSSGVADYAYSQLFEGTSNNSATATQIAQVAGNRFARAGLPSGVSRWYWVRHVDTSGNQSALFPAATAGATGITLAAEGGVATVANAAAITGNIGGPPPNGENYWAVYDDLTQKIWAWQTSTGTYSKAVSAADIAGTLADAQIASVAASKVTGQLTDSQVANVNAAKLIGQVVSSQIANVANTAIIGNIVSSQITSITGGQVIGNLTAANIPNANIIGQLVSSQIANVANTAIIGNIIDSQLSTITASKVLGNLTAANIPNTRIIGQLVSSQIANVANTAIIGNIIASQIASITGSQVIGNLTAANIPNTAIIGNIIASQITSVANTQITGTLTDSQLANIAAAKLTGQITTTQITDNAITTPKILAGAVVANSIAAGAIVAEKIATDAVTADKILANAVVAGKIAANAVVAVSIAANAITSDKIVSNTINATHIVAGAITSDKIAANAVVANAIAAGVITSDKIAANTIAGDRLLANTITAAQIATGAITADELAANSVTANAILANAVTTAKLAAGSVTTNKLVVVGTAEALNDDPNTQDITAWSTTPANSAIVTTDSTAPNGNQVLRISATGPTVISARAIPLDPNKAYQLRLWTRSSTGSTTTYLTVAFYDANGNNIDANSSNATGWGSIGTFHYWGLIAQTVPSTWTEYRVSFGGNEPITIPTAARFCRVGVLGNWAGTGVQDVTGIRLMLKSDADLIVDGAIVANKIAANAVVASKIAADAVTANAIAANAVVASKIAANAVTANAILAGSVTADKIAVNAVTANVIAAGTITGDKIAANTIGADRLVANSITATQIQAGAIGASSLAANSVTAAAIAANAVVAGDIAAGAVTAGTIAANAVTATEIAAGTITGNKIAANTILGSSIVAGNITGDRIAANTITGNLIQAGSIAADRLSVTNLAAISANLGNITAGNLNIGSGRFQVNNSGDITIVSAASGARLEITSTVIRVYDTAGVLRVKLGSLA